MNKDQQNGATAIIWLFWMCTIGFFLYIIILLIPIYMTDSTIKGTLKEMQSRPDIVTSMTTGTAEPTIRAYLQKNFAINNIQNISQDNIEIKSAGDGNGLLVTISYDVRKPIVANIDMLVHFNDSAKVTGS